MNREALAVLRKHEPEVKANGVLGISIFGSAARGDNATDSDVDLTVRLARISRAAALTYFRRLDELEHRLTHLLGCSVHVIEEPARKYRLRAEIDMDRVLAF